MWAERLKKIYVVMRTWKMKVGGPRKRERPKLGWADVVRKGMKESGLKIDEAQERLTWILKTRSADPKSGKGRRKRGKEGS